MFSILLIAVSVYALSLFGFGVSLLKAPAGYEDSQGFHFGIAPRRVILARRR